jgi:hypothetical protein
MDRLLSWLRIRWLIHLVNLLGSASMSSRRSPRARLGVVCVKSGFVKFGSALARINNSMLGAIRHQAAWTSADHEPVSGFDALRGHKYALLTTYRKNGDPVPTPVWFGLDEDGAVYFYADETSGKV